MTPRGSSFFRAPGFSVGERPLLLGGIRPERLPRPRGTRESETWLGSKKHIFVQPERIRHLNC